MKRKKNLLFPMICVSVALHGAIFFLAPVYPANNPLSPNPNHSSDPFALVNLAVIEPAAALPPSPPPKPSPPPPVLPEELPEDIADMEPAENFIPVADFIPVNLDLAGPAENPAAGSAGEDSAGPSSGAANTALGMAAATDYVKHNYEYIQRRIRDKLAYPAQARRAGLQGSAEISFTIHEDGSVSDVTITSSSGSELLDTVAMEAIRAASPFRPPPAEARLAIPVTFRLR